MVCYPFGMNEQEQLALAERIIALSRDYVLRDPNWRRDGPGVHTRTSEDLERQERLHAELEVLFEQWADRRAATS